MALEFPLPVKAVTIDLDGTLLDTIPDLAVAANMMLAEIGRPPLDEAVIRTFVGKGIANLVGRTLAGQLDPQSVEPALMERCLAIYGRCYDGVNGRHTTLYPGVREGLDALAAKGLPLACVTNKSARYTLPLLEQVGLARYFRQVVSGDTLPRKKPDPDPLLHACEIFGIRPAEMVMIGDSLNDAQAARAAGCPVICVTYGYNEGESVHTLDADALVESLVDAADLVRKA